MLDFRFAESDVTADVLCLAAGAQGNQHLVEVGFFSTPQQRCFDVLLEVQLAVFGALAFGIDNLSFFVCQAHFHFSAFHFGSLGALFWELSSST